MIYSDSPDDDGGSNDSTCTVRYEVHEQDAGASLSSVAPAAGQEAAAYMLDHVRQGIERLLPNLPPQPMFDVTIDLAPCVRVFRDENDALAYDGMAWS